MDVSGRSADINMSGNNISEIIPVDSSMKNIQDTDTVSELDKKKCWIRYIRAYQSTFIA